MFDANGSRFFPLIGQADLAPRAAGLRWEPALQALLLARTAVPRLPRGERAAVRAAREAAAPMVLDRFGQFGRLAADGMAVEVLLDGRWIPLRDRDGTALAPAAGRFTAMALGEERLALLHDDGAGGHGVQVFHLRHRWPVDRPGETRLALPAPGLAVAVAPDGMLWVATADALLGLAGQPLPAEYEAQPARFEPVVNNRRGLAIHRRIPLAAGPGTLAVAVDAEAAWLLLDRDAAPQEVWRRPLAAADDRDAWARFPLPPHGDGEAPYFADLTPLGEGRLALLSAPDAEYAGFARRDCAVFLLGPGGLAPAGERWPMLAPPAARFVSAADGRAWYATAEGPRALAMLRHPAHPAAAATPLGPLDARLPGTVWHRLHLDARIAPGCAIRLWARAAEAALPAGPAAALAPVLTALQAEDGAAVLDALLLTLLLDRGAVPDAGTWEALAALPEASLARLAASSRAGLARLAEDADPALQALAPHATALQALAGSVHGVLAARGPPPLADGALRRLAVAPPPLRRFLAANGPLAARLRAGLAADTAARDALLTAILDRPLHRQPPLVWSPTGSEIPFHPGFCPPEPRVAGSFELLLQASTGAVRRLAGRWLELFVVLAGDGRSSPTLHALRAHAPRFSYQEHYLPPLFRQAEPPGGPPGPANGADLRERLLSVFEAVLTPLESRIADSETLLDPTRAPAAALPFIASLFGRAAEPGWAEPRQRALLGRLGAILARRGTLAGVCDALDVASDGGVRRGEVVVVENFRLRRSMATILGIPMDDAAHPLTLGSGVSGNSIVGDTLILSEATTRDFLALFAPELARRDEQAAVRAFFDRFAHQVSILLHGRGAAARTAVEATARREMPAHLQWRIYEAAPGFVLGLAPLLGIDSFIGPEPDPAPIVLDAVAVGRGGLVTNPAALAPEAVRAASRPDA